MSTAKIGTQLFIPAAKLSELGEVVAIASRDVSKAKAAAQQLQLPRAYGSYDALLADPDIDAVYVSLPNLLHTEWTVRCAQAGKHVLCEKPVARTVAAAERMATVCQDNKVIYMEAFMYRHHPVHARVRSLLTEGAIGQPRLIRASFCFHLGDPETNIRANKILEGGSLMDVGCYPVNLARFLFDAEPTEVIAMQQNWPGFDVDLTFGALLRFSDGRTALIDSSFDVNSGGKYEVSGPRGSISVERAFTPGDAPMAIRIVAGQNDRTIEISGVNQYAREVDHFARSVRAGLLLPPAEDGVSNTRVIEALYSSANEGRAIRL